MKPWQIGNTTVRSGLRTRDALIALEDSDHQGSIRGADGDKRFRKILGNAGVVNLGDDKTVSVGRKFRSVMGQLGFLYPEAKRGLKQSDIGPLDSITPAGKRFINANTTAGQQECFLRALVGKTINLRSSRYESPGAFSPLLHVLRVMANLEKRCGDSKISFVEFAIFVQVTDHEHDIDELVENIFEFRKSRGVAINKKRFDNDSIAKQRLDDGSMVSESTYRDYADMNIRYLRATGLFGQSGRGISFFEHRKDVIDELIVRIVPILEPKEYWGNLTQGAELPLDDADNAKSNLLQLIRIAEERRITISVDVAQLNNAADLEVARYEIEEKIAIDEEHDFAKAQAMESIQIGKYLQAIESGRIRIAAGDEEEVVIPTGEAPAYLEWSVWRAFLAINRISNPPSESRGFRIDRGFLPVCHAPGGRADLIFEFESFVLVVEVTLLTSGRQEAAEGYPVRQHVFQEKMKYEHRLGIPVYGLFIAPTMNPNTIATFKNGEFHDAGHEYRLDIIPVTIARFIFIFKEMFSKSSINHQHFQILIEQCLDKRDSAHTPQEWNEAIEELIDDLVTSF